MYIRNNRLSACLKGLISLSAFLGILLQCGVFSGSLNLTVLTYYTMMSNIACAVYYLPAAIYQARKGETLLPKWKGALVMCITVTGLVYQTLLSGRFEMQGTLLLSTLLLHYVVPVACVLDWLLFDRKGRYSWKMPLAWMLAPGAYFVFVMVAVRLGAHLGPYGEKYPYFFMDVDTLGFGMVLLIALAMGVFFIILGYLLVLLDHKLGKREESHLEKG